MSLYEKCIKRVFLSSNNLVYLWLNFAFLYSCLVACSDPLAQIACRDKQDCPVDHICVEKVCQKQEITAPAGTEQNFQCLTDQECSEVAECISLGCRCVEGLCFPNECQDGDKRSCETMCGIGEQTCSSGVWRTCNKQAGNEICGTMEDEDCDGMIDEGCSGCEEGEERACNNGCGEGIEYCFDNSFIGCTAPRARLEICGTAENPVDEDCDGMVDEGCSDCEEGSMRTCDQGCGEGQETCIENTWRNCSAPTPTDEVCDGVDNDCDQAVDEEITRDCSTACGSGIETCSTGAWMNCTAPTVCMCGDLRMDSQVCGICGARQRTCVEDSDEWGEWSECVEAGQCEPGSQQEGSCGLCGVQRRNCGADCVWTGWQACQNEGVCEPGQEEERACMEGSCGVQKRTCSDQCLWGEWSECTRELFEECTPGMTENEPCGQCGQRVRTCSDACTWDVWGECQSEGSCQPGDTEDRSCGSGTCAIETRTCNEQCQWDNWGICNEGGSCEPGETQESACGNCGIKVRVCGDNCGWEAWSACQNESNVCTPGQEERLECGENNEGLCQLGEQRRVCSEMCQWNTWSECIGVVYPQEEICGNDLDENCNGQLERNPDEYENNNTCRSCTLLNMTNPDNVNMRASIDSIDDTWDYYCFYVDDGFSLFASHIVLELTNIPNEADLDLFLYQGKEGDGLSSEEAAYRNCENDVRLESSTLGRGQDESIDWTERVGWGADDSGLYIIGIQAFGNQSYSCYENYNLYVHGLR